MEYVCSSPATIILVGKPSEPTFISALSCFKYTSTSSGVAVCPSCIVANVNSLGAFVGAQCGK